MKFKIFDTVRICRDYNEQIKKGNIGAVVMVFENPNEAYEVEFLDDKGFTKALCTLPSDILEIIEV